MSVTVTGNLKSFTRGMSNLNHKFLSGLGKDVGEAMVTRSKERFDEKKNEDGTSWKPSLRAQMEGGETLQDTRRLYNSIGYEGDATKVRVGTNVAYARIHNDGGIIKAKNKPYLKFRLKDGSFRSVKQVEMPERNFLRFDKEDAARVKEICATTAKKALSV